jgi:hypothetical protein
LATVKPRDYEPGGEVESLTPYSLWKELQDSGSPHHERPLSPGDILEIIGSDGPERLLITKYIGFEPAQWCVPETKAAESPAPPSEALSRASSTDESLAPPRPEKALQS